eukprot:Sspe_Gene.95429::Locus_67720_Transcript_2_5_Confidence_0.667_Length_762::g.95429::m.95429
MYTRSVSLTPDYRELAARNRCHHFAETEERWPHCEDTSPPQPRVCFPVCMAAESHSEICPPGSPPSRTASAALEAYQKCECLHCTVQSPGAAELRLLRERCAVGGALETCQRRGVAEDQEAALVSGPAPSPSEILALERSKLAQMQSAWDTMTRSTTWYPDDSPATTKASARSISPPRR